MIVESHETWSRIFTDVEVWREMIEQICYEHRLVPAEKITAGHPGSNAVFLVDDAVVVKIFSPFGREWVVREIEISQLLQSYKTIPVPRLLASGLIKEEQDWPYIVTEMLPGERIGGIWEKISYENRLAIAERVGKMVRTLHTIPISKVKSMDRSRRYWERFVETQIKGCVEHHRQKQSLPNHLLEQIPD
ncbi:MAG: aminoglycoside 3'-phosphotransferase/choline kinase family protein, partial [Candidatus Tectomicrobia bacterium]|nr:aminoglycoside 3'-phosphotransferase/choline kinase family protein [Candidatus Tectomicrobia bacterium]